MSTAEEKKETVCDVNDVVEMVSEMVEKYNSLLRMNHLFMGFVHEMELEEQLLAYLQRQGLPPRLPS